MKNSLEKHILLNPQDYASIIWMEEKSHINAVEEGNLEIASAAEALPRGSNPFRSRRFTEAFSLSSVIDRPSIPIWVKLG